MAAHCSFCALSVVTIVADLPEGAHSYSSHQPLRDLAIMATDLPLHSSGMSLSGAPLGTPTSFSGINQAHDPNCPPYFQSRGAWAAFNTVSFLSQCSCPFRSPLRMLQSHHLMALSSRLQIEPGCSVWQVLSLCCHSIACQGQTCIPGLLHDGRAPAPPPPPPRGPCSGAGRGAGGQLTLLDL